LKFYTQSLRNRIFISMLVLVVLASILMAAVTVYQYREEAEDYHHDRLERKQENIMKHISDVLDETTFPVETVYLPLIFKKEIYKIKRIHSLEIYLYDLEGSLLTKSRASFIKDTTKTCLSALVLNELNTSADKSFVQEFEENGENYQSSYTYVTDKYFKPLAILNLPYIEDDGFIKKELRENLTRLAFTYLFMLLLAITLAYFLSKYITKSLNSISQKIIETRFDKRNKRIEVENTTEEITNLVKAYNGMIDELEVSAAKLATNEREAAWREMAKQVAHEIKNPLTPMRLTVQSFQRKFDPEDPEINDKVNEYSNILIQQIDTMSSIASAFSNYAQMPAQKEETLNVVKITKLALDIFNEDYIYFESKEEEIIARFDRTQLIRVVTNLVKNSTQAIQQKNPENPKIEVRVFLQENDVVIEVKDNGVGISQEYKEKVFEPKFTTKNSGMGLGLAMVKNIVETFGGVISLSSQQGEETIFTVKFPKQS
jgi:two-component system nitrogen regulation sensor histidine kinase NtrY